MPPLIRSLTVATVGALGCATLLSFAAPLGATGQLAGAGCVVTTALGSLRGLEQGGVCTFSSVPFAAPPINDLRWKPPAPRAAWAPEILDVRTPPAVVNCTQVDLAGVVSGREDCLQLNIWAPTHPRRLPAPVLVWFHTGAFGNTGRQNGRRLAEERGLVVVAPNYRLGPLGFLAHRALAAEDPAYPVSGTYGLLDQRAALMWVRDHIAAFGGDPRNITIDGTSAGSHSVSFHMISPRSRGLFHRAIMQSSYGSTRLRSKEESEALGEAFARAAGCVDASTVLTCLRSRTAQQMVTALPHGQQQFVDRPRTDWTPGVDGVEIPEQPRDLYARGEFARVPLLIGVNRDEGWTYVDRSFPTALSESEYFSELAREFGEAAPAIAARYPAAHFATPKDALAAAAGDVEMVCEARRVARAVQKTGMPVYFYSFEYQVAVLDGGRAGHGLESNFLFGNDFGPRESNYVLNAADLSLFSTMSTYWSEFAHRGDPNDGGLPAWPRFISAGGEGAPTDRHLVLDTTIGEGSFIRDQYCNFWDHYFLRSIAGTVPAARP